MFKKFTVFCNHILHNNYLPNKRTRKYWVNPIQPVLSTNNHPIDPNLLRHNTQPIQTAYFDASSIHTWHITKITNIITEVPYLHQVHGSGRNDSAERSMSQKGKLRRTEQWKWNGLIHQLKICPFEYYKECTFLFDCGILPCCWDV